ncbi:MAG: YncE family protein [Bacteroidia bacterium]|nr:YncE family protein [Bacteroidia bacterium]
MKNIQQILLVLLAGIFLFACDDLVSIVPDPNNHVSGTGALYILCDGNYSLNNSTLGVYDFSKKTFTSNFFQAKNGRKLGDTGNDLQRSGSKLYVVVNGSSQVEVLDARTGISLKQISLFNGTTARQPRSIAFWEDKVYVCSFDGTVARIDTASLEIEAFINVGRNPDGITASNNKLYVSNSGGLDYGSTLGYDHTVSVISTETFTETKRIEVGLNPGRIKADNYGYVYVSVRGDYKEASGNWVCIDTQSDAVVATYDFQVTNFDLCGEKAYFYSYDESSKESTIGVFNLQTKLVQTTAFIQDGTQLKTPYGITADPQSGAVFITDAGDYVSSGDVFCFSEAGILSYKLSNVGINPNMVLPVADFKNAAGSETDSVRLEGIQHVPPFQWGKASNKCGQKQKVNSNPAVWFLWDASVAA